MADEDEDKSSKTEEPSERKLTKAREQGNVPKSREVNNFFVLLAILVAILTTLHFAWARLLNLFGGTFSELGFKRASNASEVGGSMVFMVQEMFIVLAPTFLLLLVFAYFGGFIQNGFVASVEPLKPKLSKISLIKGFGRLFSMRSFAEFLKSLAKMVVLGAVIYFILYIHMEEIVVLTDKTVMDTAMTVEVILVRIILAVLAIAGLI
ncbi:MAG: EscU/YscU/HrcU family type III secretion system export apparatus switch protein, partial [Pseudomonadota bacterium]|nr:EscU/YscU/HrcU family type III secretion system export apparatus switch protein [Pseudomonadota bacterium]